MYVKFVRDTLRSSLNDTPVETRWTFFTCCLMADWDGWFTSTPSGIAREANLPLAVVIESLETLQAPDPNTTTPGDDGVRVKYHGNNRWFVCNIAKYRASDDIEARRAIDRERQARHRNKSRTEPLPSRDNNVTSRHKDIDKDKEIEQAASAHTCVRGEVFEGGEQDKPQGIEFDAAAGRFIGITPENIDSWRKAFPGVPIEADVLQAAAYYKAHPERMGKGKAEGRLLAWFKRSQKGPAEMPAQKATSYVIPATPDRFKPPHDAAEHELLPPTIDWPSVLEVVRDKVSPQVYDKWLAGIPYLGDYITHEGSAEVRHAVLQVADEYSRNHIHYNLGPSLADAISDVMGCLYRLAFKVVNAGV